MREHGFSPETEQPFWQKFLKTMVRGVLVAGLAVGVGESIFNKEAAADFLKALQGGRDQLASIYEAAGGNNLPADLKVARSLGAN